MQGRGGSPKKMAASAFLTKILVNFAAFSKVSFWLPKLSSWFIF